MNVTPAIPCPLGAEHCQLLTNALQKCHDLNCLLKVLQEAGLPVEDRINEVAHYQRLASTLKAKLFPDQP